MRKIKFRGRYSHTGQYIYGDLSLWAWCDCFEEARIYSWGNGIAYDVEPDSVEQYAFTDSNGNEIYTGDTVISEDGTEYTVKLVPIAENENEYVRLDTELDNRAFELKDSSHD